MIDPLTYQLFGQFPRDVANPTRMVANNLNDFIRFLQYNEGVKDCYTALYPFAEHGMMTIDKISLDFDKHPGLNTGVEALNDAKRVYKNCVSKGYPTVPVASGKKGIHTHTLLEPRDYPEREGKILLYRATIKILEDTFGEIEQGMEYDDTNKPVAVYYAVNEDHRVIGADPKVVGDVRRIFRILNTRRPPENKSWCTYLPHTFTEMSWLDIICWCKEPHTSFMPGSPTLSLEDMPQSERAIEVNPASNLVSSVPIPSHPNQFLEEILRPCLYYAITAFNPVHPARVATTIDLLRDWSINEIMDIYSGLNWPDWDPETSRKQIVTCTKYESYSCTKLKQLGLCLVDDFEDCPARSQENGSMWRKIKNVS